MIDIVVETPIYYNKQQISCDQMADAATIGRMLESNRATWNSVWGNKVPLIRDRPGISGLLRLTGASNVVRLQSMLRRRLEKGNTTGAVELLLPKNTNPRTTCLRTEGSAITAEGVEIHAYNMLAHGKGSAKAASFLIRIAAESQLVTLQL
jgi:hypothetical protein